MTSHILRHRLNRKTIWVETMQWHCERIIRKIKRNRPNHLPILVSARPRILRKMKSKYCRNEFKMQKWKSVRLFDVIFLFSLCLSSDFPLSLHHFEFISFIFRWENVVKTFQVVKLPNHVLTICLYVVACALSLGKRICSLWLRAKNSCDKAAKVANFILGCFSVSSNSDQNETKLLHWSENDAFAFSALIIRLARAVAEKTNGRTGVRAWMDNELAIGHCSTCKLSNGNAVVCVCVRMHRSHVTSPQEQKANCCDNDGHSRRVQRIRYSRQNAMNLFPVTHYTHNYNFEISDFFVMFFFYCCCCEFIVISWLDCWPICNNYPKRQCNRNECVRRILKMRDHKSSLSCICIVCCVAANAVSIGGAQSSFVCPKCKWFSLFSLCASSCIWTSNAKAIDLSPSLHIAHAQTRQTTVAVATGVWVRIERCYRSEEQHHQRNSLIRKCNGLFGCCAVFGMKNIM